jgi:hypothetical protein
MTFPAIGLNSAGPAMRQQICAFIINNLTFCVGQANFRVVVDVLYLLVSSKRAL